MNNKRGINLILLAALLVVCAVTRPAQAAAELPAEEYLIGVGDVLRISVLQPEKFDTSLTVAPDGTICFPFIGTVKVRDLTLSQVQEKIQAQLAEGYMKYPVVAVAMTEWKSKTYFVYGAVNRPDTYFWNENITVLKAVSIAGGFSGQSEGTRVRIFRPKQNGAEYELIPVQMREIMAGKGNEDIFVHPGDIIVVTDLLYHSRLNK